MALTFVASTRQTTNPWGSQAGATKTTDSFSVVAGDVLVCLAGGEDGLVGLSGIVGGSLTWASQDNVGTANSSARAASWTATVDVDKSMTVSLTNSSTIKQWGLVIHQWRESSGIGAHASQENLTGGLAPSLPLTTTGANSAISYFHTDWSSSNGATRTWRTINSITPTAGNSLETDYYRDSGGTQYALYAGYWNDAGAVGSKTTGIVTPSTQQPNIVAVEILGISGPFTPSYTDWPLRQPHPKMRGAA